MQLCYIVVPGEDITTLKSGSFAMSKGIRAHSLGLYKIPSAMRNLEDYVITLECDETQGIVARSDCFNSLATYEYLAECEMSFYQINHYLIEKLVKISRLDILDFIIDFLDRDQGVDGSIYEYIMRSMITGTPQATCEYLLEKLSPHHKMCSKRLICRAIKGCNDWLVMRMIEEANSLLDIYLNDFYLKSLRMNRRVLIDLFIKLGADINGCGDLFKEFGYWKDSIEDKIGLLDYLFDLGLDVNGCASRINLRIKAMHSCDECELNEPYCKHFDSISRDVTRLFEYLMEKGLDAQSKFSNFFLSAVESDNIHLMKLALGFSQELIPNILEKLTVRNLSTLKFLLENGAQHRIGSYHYLTLLLIYYGVTYRAEDLLFDSYRNLLMETVRFLANFDCGLNDLGNTFMAYLESSLDDETLGSYLLSMVDFEDLRPKIESHIDKLISNWYSFSIRSNRIKVLIEKGFDPSYKSDSILRTSLMVINKKREIGERELDMFLFLIEKGCDIRNVLISDEEIRAFCNVVHKRPDTCRSRIEEVLVKTFGEDFIMGLDYQSETYNEY